MDPNHDPCTPYNGLFLKDVINSDAAHPPHETDNELRLSEIEKVFNSLPFHQSVNYDHLRVWPNIQHLLEPCPEQDSKIRGRFTFMVSNELEPSKHEFKNVYSKITQKLELFHSRSCYH
ncbi:hypothetical protein NPIL_210071 [Nephila pilipes]|uniref:Uncharacterized protein n=1 Tax=Nephila pilipes TaxID=299642 RepID=A0A8X6PFF3_NEPPI|nr:hypothetical protein NPIL_210071 [Nephila pilipes]